METQLRENALAVSQVLIEVKELRQKTRETKARMEHPLSAPIMATEPPQWLDPSAIQQQDLTALQQVDSKTSTASYVQLQFKTRS